MISVALPLLLALSALLACTEGAWAALDPVRLSRLDPDSPLDRMLRAAHDGSATTTLRLSALASELCVLVVAGISQPWPFFLGLSVGLWVLRVTGLGLGDRLALGWARAAVLPLTLAIRLSAPLRWALTQLQRPLQIALRAQPIAEGLDEDDLRELLDRGAADAMEREIIESVFEFDDLTVDRVMTPRPDIFAVPIDIDWPDLREACRQHPFSRIPVYGERSDDIQGVLLLKDMLPVHKTPPSLHSLLLPPVYVPASKPADDMLRAFLERRLHMAFVVDEHGTLVGVVTIDDLLDELVGELEEDRTDSDIQHGPDVLSVKAAIDLHDFCEETGLTLPAGDYHTVGGFVFHQLGRLPRVGDVIDSDGLRFEVSAMDGRRIDELRITKEAP